MAINALLKNRGTCFPELSILYLEVDGDCVSRWICISGEKRLTENVSLLHFQCFDIFPGEMLNFSFLVGEVEAKQFRDGALGLILSPSDTSPEFQQGYHMLLFSDVMHHGSTGLMHQSKEDHAFKAGMSGNKVQSINSRRKHKQLN